MATRLLTRIKTVVAQANDIAVYFTLFGNNFRFIGKKLYFINYGRWQQIHEDIIIIGNVTVIYNLYGLFVVYDGNLIVTNQKNIFLHEGKYYDYLMKELKITKISNCQDFFITGKFFKPVFPAKVRHIVVNEQKMTLTLFDYRNTEKCYEGVNEIRNICYIDMEKKEEIYYTEHVMTIAKFVNCGTYIEIEGRKYEMPTKKPLYKCSNIYFTFCDSKINLLKQITGSKTKPALHNNA